MTGPEHYRAAERLLSDASFEDSIGNPVTRQGLPMRLEANAALIARAKVHADLARIAANVSMQPLVGDPESRGLAEEDWDEWQEALHSTTTNEEN
ncbi:hypothetical protein [Streptomyces sp. NPDC002952]|uniref:hypothetical protein n=1 Tax=Streptomyces sp. NPDC002952 TaxID=3364673 RepID=UPI00368C0DC3